MKPTWSYRDLYDLEYFFHLDAQKSQEALHQRDREIYLEITETEPIDSSGTLLFLWLQRIRNGAYPDKEAASPGTCVHESYRLLTIILILSGLAGGVLGGLGFFTYSGTTPVNVFHFLFLFVFSQIGLLLISVATFLAGISFTGKPILSSSVTIYGAMIAGFAARMQKRLSNVISADNHNRVQQFTGIIKKTSKKYGLLIYWPIFTISQKMVVAINVGLLTATLFRVATSDLAFGWQSTIQFSSEALFKTAELLALPWSWLVSKDMAYPSMEAIEGSRIILKDGIYHLTTQDLVAWWPFLVFCLLVYGLLFRLILLLLGIYLQRRSLSKLPLKTPDVLNIIRRMKAPLVSTQAPPLSAEPNQTPRSAVDHEKKSPPDHHDGGVALTLLIPADIIVQYERAQGNSLLEKNGFVVNQQITVMEDYDSDQQVLSELSGHNWKNGPSVLLVMESWMPPIAEVLHFIRELRRSVADTTPIYIGLVGRVGDSTFLPPAKQDCTIWRQKLEGIGDPYLSLILLSNAK